VTVSPEISTPHEENAERYRDIVENASDLIFTVDLDDRITSVNAAFERAVGRSRADLLGRPLSSVVAPAWHGQLRDATSAKFRRGPKATVYDLELVAEDGRTVPVEVSSWIVVEDGQPRAIQAICRDMSERNAAEAALRTMRATLAERDDFLRRAFEDTAVSMVVTTADGLIERANQAFCDLLGYAEAELGGTSMLDITHPDDRTMVLTAIGQLRSGELRRFTGEKRYRCKDGGTVRVQIGISPILSATGEVTSFISQILDVTEQRAVEAALRETGELFRAAFEDVEAGMMLVAPDGRIVHGNASVCELLGYTPEELRELDVVALSHPDDHHQTREALAGLASGELNSQTVEKRYLRKSGEAVWARRSISTVRDANGDLTCTVAQINDVSARRQSEERFRRLFESSPQGMAVVDESGSLLQANTALGEILGCDSRELVGRTFTEFTHPDDCGADLELYTELMEGRRTHYELEKRYLRPDGALVWGHLTAFALPNPGGGPRLAIGILGDITERRALEEQLRQSQRMEAVGQLAGGVAHDFNNLLTAVTSYCDLASDALEDGGNPALRTSVDGIRSAANRAADVTRQLLAFSRRQVLELKPLDLNAAVTGQAGLFRRLLGDNVDVRLALEAGLSAVTMDPGQLAQVVMNLAVNARDAMPDGGILTIETQSVDLERAPTMTGIVSGPHVLLAVSDTGCGMTQATRERIFEPFFTTKEPGKGTGLGLSTVLGIVEQSGGRVSVYSEPGVGTTFKVYMPRGGVAPAPEPAPEGGVGTQDRPVGSGVILLVEDNDAVRRPVARLLSDFGYDVVAADGPEEALRLAAGRRLDLLVTDVVMPTMNGRQLAERLLADRSDLKVLYMSGYTDDAVIARGVIEPGTAFLQKPFGADRLAQKIRELLDAD
jgi:two-component system cell cycle sensor histidine kinase/response regulator CckA